MSESGSPPKSAVAEVDELKAEIRRLKRIPGMEMMKAYHEEKKAQISALTSRLIQQRRRIAQLEEIQADVAAHFEPRFASLRDRIRHCNETWRSQRARIESMEQALQSADRFLLHLSEWDMFNPPDVTADGPYWQQQILLTRQMIASATAALPPPEFVLNSSPEKRLS